MKPGETDSKGPCDTRRAFLAMIRADTIDQMASILDGKEGCLVIRRQLTAAIAVLVIALLGLTGCAGKLRLSPKVMCEAHGGTYNATAKSCTYTAQTRSARQICESHPNGYWDDAAGFCELN